MALSTSFIMGIVEGSQASDLNQHHHAMNTDQTVSVRRDTELSGAELKLSQKPETEKREDNLVSFL